MVGAINAPTTGANTFAAYQAAAEKLGGTQPQDTHPGGLLGLGASATASAGPAGGTGAAGQVNVGSTSLLAILGLAFAML